MSSLKFVVKTTVQQTIVWHSWHIYVYVIIHSLRKKNFIRSTSKRDWSSWLGLRVIPSTESGGSLVVYEKDNTIFVSVPPWLLREYVLLLSENGEVRRNERSFEGTLLRGNGVLDYGRELWTVDSEDWHLWLKTVTERLVNLDYENCLPLDTGSRG